LVEHLSCKQEVRGSRPLSGFGENRPLARRFTRRAAICTSRVLYVAFQLLLPAIIGTVTLVYNFRKRHEPEPPNNPLKLPITIVALLICLGFVIAGKLPILFGLLAVGLLPQLVFMAKGRNPWWMQALMDRQKQPRRRQTAR
jgi:amino acid transporter